MVDSDKNDKNEVSLTASYYHLFRTTQQQRQLSLQNHHEQTPIATNDTLEATACGGHWEEDQWSPEEEKEAERLLQESREKCSIRTNCFGVTCAATTSPSYRYKHKHKEDEQAWNKFYSQHQTNFFKDRHYLHKAFPEEFCPPGNAEQDPLQEQQQQQQQQQQRTLVEIGCGVGNLLLPLLENNDNNDNASSNSDPNNNNLNHNHNHNNNEYRWTVHGLDLSKVAIEWLQKDERFIRAAAEGRAAAHVCDIAAPYPESLPIQATIRTTRATTITIKTTSIPEACQGVADVCTLLFCLSSITPGPPMLQAVHNVAATLKPHTGVLVFRDYGRFDEAQMKLGTSRKKQLDHDNFYRKHDGTKCYYFTLQDVKELLEGHAGLKILELNYLRRIYRNRATNEVRRRVWVQGRFQKVS